MGDTPVDLLLMKLQNLLGLLDKSRKVLDIIFICFSTFFLGGTFEFTVSCNVTFLFGFSSFVEASFLPPRHLFYCVVNPRLAKSG